VQLLLMKAGHGDVLLAEGDLDVPEDEARLVAAFRAQLDAGMTAAVPVGAGPGRRQATMVRELSEVPRNAERVVFFPRPSGG
jgi:hypothetical protein